MIRLACVLLLAGCTTAEPPEPPQEPEWTDPLADCEHWRWERTEIPREFRIRAFSMSHIETRECIDP